MKAGYLLHDSQTNRQVFLKIGKHIVVVAMNARGLLVTDQSATTIPVRLARGVEKVAGRDKEDQQRHHEHEVNRLCAGGSPVLMARARICLTSARHSGSYKKSRLSPTDF